MFSFYNSQKENVYVRFSDPKTERSRKRKCAITGHPFGVYPFDNGLQAVDIFMPSDLQRFLKIWE